MLNYLKYDHRFLFLLFTVCERLANKQIALLFHFVHEDQDVPNCFCLLSMQTRQRTAVFHR